jgi:hypothetical protein
MAEVSSAESAVVRPGYLFQNPLQTRAANIQGAAVRHTKRISGKPLRRALRVAYFQAA